MMSIFEPNKAKDMSAPNGAELITQPVNAGAEHSACSCENLHTRAIQKKSQMERRLVCWDPNFASNPPWLQPQGFRFPVIQKVNKKLSIHQYRNIHKSLKVRLNPNRALFKSAAPLNKLSSKLTQGILVHLRFRFFATRSRHQ